MCPHYLSAETDIGLVLPDRRTEAEAVRPLTWDEAAMVLAYLHPSKRRNPHGLWVMSGGNRFIHYVPRPLRHIGCMWLEDGDEAQRCGVEAAWTMGRDLALARLYCEEHARLILARRAEIRQRNARSRRQAHLQEQT